MPESFLARTVALAPLAPSVAPAASRLLRGPAGPAGSSGSGRAGDARPRRGEADCRVSRASIVGSMDRDGRRRAHFAREASPDDIVGRIVRSL